MVNKSNGLEEIFHVFQQSEAMLQEQKSTELDFEKGILQAIGYKEFYSFYQYMLTTYGTI